MFHSHACGTQTAAAVAAAAAADDDDVKPSLSRWIKTHGKDRHHFPDLHTHHYELTAHGRRNRSGSATQPTRSPAVARMADRTAP